MESVNLQNNPVKTKNLSNLTSTQFSKLVQGIKDKKFRVVSWQGTVLMDLLEYAKDLVARGHTTHNSHMVYLQTLTTKQPNKIAQVQPKIEQNNTKSPNPNLYLLIAGLGLIGIVFLAIGYWRGRKKKVTSANEFQIS